MGEQAIAEMDSCIQLGFILGLFFWGLYPTWGPIHIATPKLLDLSKVEEHYKRTASDWAVSERGL